MQAQDGVSDILKENSIDSSHSATFPRATFARTYRKSILRHSSSTTQGPEAGPSSLHSSSPPATPPRPRTSLRQPLGPSSVANGAQLPETPPNHKGKRKAEEIDITPPDPGHVQHTTFAIPSPSHRRKCTFGLTSIWLIFVGFYTTIRRSFLRSTSS